MTSAMPTTTPVPNSSTRQAPPDCAPRGGPLMEDSAVLDQLRFRVTDCVDKHLFTTAVFFADKLVTLSDGAAEDVYLLAQARTSPALALAPRGLKARLAQSRRTFTADSTAARSRCCAPRSSRLRASASCTWRGSALSPRGSGTRRSSCLETGARRTRSLLPGLAPRHACSRPMRSAAAAQRPGWTLTHASAGTALTTVAWPQPLL